MKKIKFYQIISDLVDIKAQERKLTRLELAIILGISESYVKQIHSAASNKHYNIFHVYLLAKEWKIKVDELSPSRENLKKLKQYSTLDDNNLNMILTEIEYEIKENENNE